MSIILKNRKWLGEKIKLSDIEFREHCPHMTAKILPPSFITNRRFSHYYLFRQLNIGEENLKKSNSRPFSGKSLDMCFSSRVNAPVKRVKKPVILILRKLLVSSSECRFEVED